MAWTPDNNLQTWPQVQAEVEGEWSLLLGNGFSRNIWGDFAYPTLQGVAARAPQGPNDTRLSVTSQQLFTRLGSTNFEEVLRYLHSARIVAQVAGNGAFDRVVEALEINVRNSLASAVRDVHVAHADLRQHLATVRAELRNYVNVFTTNYDLIPYWAIMENGDPAGFVDFFWGAGRTFDRRQIAVWDDDATRVYYLHGALHLFDDDHGRIEKLTNANFDVLLDQCLTRIETVRSPHFISEGTHQKKRAEIKASDYLDFCFRSFERLSTRLVILGHGLDVASDNHLIEAMCGQEFAARQIAISVFPAPNVPVLPIQQALAARLHGKDLFFFDSTTHPLGDGALAV